MLFSSLASAQITNVTDDTSTPTPGTGHDYVKMLSETVNPANGSLSIRIQVPVPKGRELTVPFSFAYDSNGVLHLVGDNAGGASWFSNTTFLSQGGWSYSVPLASIVGANPYGCQYFTDYVFQDPSGGRHALGLAVAENGTTECQGIPSVPYGAPWGGDNFFIATTPASPWGTQLFNPPPLTVSDLDGTVYDFPTLYVHVTPLGGYASSLPDWIEDRNGNKINVVDDNLKSGKAVGAFTFTDTLSRSSIKSDGFGPIGATNNLWVSGLTNSYQISWTSANASYAVPSTQVESSPGGCAPFPPVSNTPLPVIQTITLPDQVSTYQFSYGGIPNGPYNPYGLLSEIKYPNGATVDYSWALNNDSELAAYADGNGAAAACQYEYATPKVSERVVTVNGQEVLDQTFSYATQNWALRGFYTWGSKTTAVTTTDMARDGHPQSVTNYTYYPSPSPFDGATQPNDISYTASQIPVEQQVTYNDFNGNPLKTVTKGWQSAGLMICEVDTWSGTGQTSGQFYTYQPGPYGMVAVMNDKKEYDYTAGISPSSCTSNQNGITPPANWTRDTAIAPQTFGTTLAGGTILDRPSTITVSGVTGATTTGTASETIYSYAPNATTGNPTAKTEKCLYNCAQDAVTPYFYNSDGQVNKVTDPNGNSTEYAYQCSDAYISTITNPLGQYESFSYDCTSGRLLSSTDLNHQPTTYSYADSDNHPDLLGRLMSISYPDGGSTTYTYGSNACAQPSTTSKAMSPSPTYSESATLDGLCRVTESTVADTEGAINTDTVYDGMGRVWKASIPYRGTSPNLNTITTFDSLGRVSDWVVAGNTSVYSIVYPDGSTTSTTYSGNSTTVTDPAGAARTLVNDALGRLTKVTEDPGTGNHLNYATGYSYDALSDLLTVSQSGQSRSFTYDSFSHLYTAQNPESNVSGTPCLTTYGYDPNGNVISKIAPAENQNTSCNNTVTTTYTYDLLNRLQYKYSSDNYTARACYAYDGAGWSGWSDPFSNAVGHLTASWSVQHDGTVVAANEFYQFDQMGRMQAGRQCTPGTCGLTSYPIAAGYDLAGNQVNFWDSSMIRYSSYDEVNRLSNFTASFNVSEPTEQVPGQAGPGSQALLNISTHSPFGGLTNASLGNGLAETRNYNTRGWLGSISVGSIYSLTMGYAGNGNVTSAVDSVNGTWGYGYDPLNRLHTATVTAQSFTYSPDPWGNMTCTNSGSLPCTPLGMSFNTATNQIAPDGLHTYDVAGNLITDGTHGYVYDAENRITCVVGTDGTCTSPSAVLYFYDPQGQRVGKQQGNAMEDYVHDPQRHISSVHDGSTNLLRSELYSPDGRHVATLEGSTLTTSNLIWNHADWLGTERVRTNSVGTVIQSFTDTPYGMNLTCNSSSDTSPMHFTGKQRDAETGLDHFGARYFGGGNNLGRFMTPDQSGQDAADPSDPQSWNMYAYVRNNPTNLTDPNGENYQVCTNDENGNQTCTNVADDTAFQQALSNPGEGISTSGNLTSGSIYGTDANGDQVLVGTYQHTPPTVTQEAVIDNTDTVINTGLLLAAGPGLVRGAARLFQTGLEAWLNRGAILTLGIADLPITAGEVASRALATVGEQGIKVASRDVAEQAAKDFLGPGAQPIRGDFGVGPQVGWKSADGTRVARWTSAETKGYINLVNKTTGGNLHVRW
jgi:RHS repeat-associated protein